MTPSGQRTPGRSRDGSSSRTGVFVALALAAVALRPELVGLGPLEQDVRLSLDISRAEFGVLSSLPLVGMGVFALGAGPLARRVGTRSAVGIAMWVIVAGSVLRSAAPDYTLVVVATLILAVGWE
jgi:CP family cyanate transporter-like MFS transporter